MGKAMKPTRHMRQRMGQRGINGALVDFVLEYGRPDKDCHVRDRKEALSLLVQLQREERLLKKIVDKGGVVVVAEGSALVTTYNFTGRGH